MDTTFSKVKSLKIDQVFIVYRLISHTNNQLLIQFKPFRSDLSNTYEFPNPFEFDFDFATFGGHSITKLLQLIDEIFKLNPSLEVTRLPIWIYGTVYIFFKQNQRFIHILDKNDPSGNTLFTQNDQFDVELSDETLKKIRLCLIEMQLNPARLLNS